MLLQVGVAIVVSRLVVPRYPRQPLRHAAHPPPQAVKAHVSTSILSFGILHHTQRVFPSLAKDAQLNPVCWTPTKLAMLERALPGVVAAALVMGGPPLVGGQAGVLRVNLQQCPNLPQHQVWTILNVTLSRARYRRKSPSPR